MKRIYLSIICLVVSALISNELNAYEYRKDGIGYSLIGTEAVAQVEEKMEIANIMDSIIYEGKIYRVTHINVYHSVKTLYMPLYVESLSVGGSLQSIEFHKDRIKKIKYSIGWNSRDIVINIKIGDEVNEICDGAFQNLSNNFTLYQGYIGKNVTKIGKRAFSGFMNLVSVDIPNNVKTIDNSAFRGCTNLETVTISNQVNTIGDSAFYGCSIATMAIPNKITRISDYAFSKCVKLMSISIPNSVERIGKQAFEDCNGLTSITIPNSVTSIGYSAFRGCGNMKAVTIGNSVTVIGEGAFGGCVSLSSVNISDISAWCKIKFNNTYNNYNDYTISNPLLYAHHLYINGKEVNDLIIPDDVTKIERMTFGGCSGLTSVTLSKNVEYIGSDAFYGCGNINILVSDLKSFLGINFENGLANPIKGRRLFVNGKLFEGSLYIDESYTNISNYALYGYNYLSQLIVSNPLAIDYLDLSKCDSLKQVVWISEDKLNNKLYLQNNVGFWSLPNNIYVTGKRIFSINSTQSTISYSMAEIFSNAELTIGEKTVKMDSNMFVLDGLKPLKEYIMKIKGTVFNQEVVFDYKYMTKDLDLHLELIDASNITMAVKGYNVGDANLDLYKQTLDIYEYGLDYYGGKYVETYERNEAVFGNLKPNQKYRVVYTLKCDSSTFTKDEKFTTKRIEVKFDYTAGVTTCIATGTPLPIDAVVSKCGFYSNNEESNIESTRTMKGLDPGNGYRWDFKLETNKGFSDYTSLNFYTKRLTMETQRAELVSDKKAVISAKTNCDDDSLRCGFEWRRYDAPDEMPSNIVTCPVYNGMICGTLNGLSSTTYYKFRPFYQADSGKKYFGEWIAFITADAYVYFDPIVHTYDEVEVKDNTARVKGYVLAGSDDVMEQGFEYWSSVGEHRKQQASGTLMKTTLSNLDGQTEYYFRSYVKTPKKTIYGEEQTFKTFGSNSNGIREHIYVQNNPYIYDMLGRKVNEVVKGRMYISNGKKFIAK